MSPRSRRLLRNVFGAFLSRVVNLGSTLIIIPLALRGLGDHDYGVLAVVMSTVTLFAYSDLGLGLAVVNKVASAKDAESLRAAQEAISNVWRFLVRASGAILLVGLVAVALVRASFPESSKFPTAAWCALIVCISVGLAPGLTQRILFGLERNFEANLWNTSGRVGSVLAVYLAYELRAPLFWYVIAVVGLPAAVGWVSTIKLWRANVELRPVNSMVSWIRLRGYMTDGTKFLFLQLCVFFETGIDNILIGLLQDAQAVARYDLLARLFVYVPALISMLAFPLWPAINNAKASGDTEWARNVLRTSAFGVALIALTSSSVILYFHVEFLRLWTAAEYTPNYTLAFPLAIFAVLTSLGTLQGMAMSGLGLISEQVRVLAVFLVVLIPMKILALSISGQALMVWVLVFVYAGRLAALAVQGRVGGRAAMAC
jgi:O-antigen/teichoic acid export membrane protein